MKAGAVVGVVVLALAAVGTVGFMTWWNGELTKANLEEIVCREMRSRYLLPSTCKMTSNLNNGQGGIIATGTAEFDRMDEWRWVDGEAGIHSTGKMVEHLNATLVIRRGDLSRLQRPTYDVPQVGLDAGTTKHDATWELLETEPANAAFDAMVHDGGRGHGAITYISALRRMGRSEQAVIFMEWYWRNGGFYVMGWEERMAAELDYLEQAPMLPTHRKKMKEVLAKYAKNNTWSPVLTRLEQKRKTRKPS